MKTEHATTRRRFCTSGAALLLGRRGLLGRTGMLAQMGASAPFNDSFNALRPDVAKIDRARILAAAGHALEHPPAPLTSFAAARSPGGPRDYFSQASAGDGAAPFTAHRDALLDLGLAVGALAAAHFLTAERRYADAAAESLRGWFLNPATSMHPALDFAQVQAAPVVPAPAVAAAAAPVPLTLGAQLAAEDTPQRDRPPSLSGTAAAAQKKTAAQPQPAMQPAMQGGYTGVIETLPLVEVVEAIPFLAAAGALMPDDLAGLRNWFSSYLTWLTAEQDSGPRLAALARDSRDHHATSWLLQVAQYRLFTVTPSAEPAAEDRSLAELRHRFRSVTLRSQISADGVFPQEVSTANPYRNSLFNLDMLACVCHLLSTRFENVWEIQLEDGPGMRAAIAFHYPYIANPARWPYRADARFFSELPSRRPSLLLSARAYQRPEYASLWTSLKPDPPSPEVLSTIPVHQPILWVTPAPRAPS